MYLPWFLYCLDFFMKALDTILTDSGFQVPSTDAAEALKTATAVSQ